MSYPPPPGLKNAQSSSPLPTSLPPRPPPPTNPRPSPSSNAPGARPYDGGGQSSTTGFNGFTAFQPRAIAANNQAFRANTPIVSAGPAPPSNYSSPSTYGPSSGPFAQPYQQPAGPSYYPAPTPSYDDPYVQATPPQIRNPFPLPGQNGGAPGRPNGLPAPMDPEMEAQIAQWQSAYTLKEDSLGRNRSGLSGAGSATGANSGPLGSRDYGASAMSTSDLQSAANADTGVASVVTGADGKQKTVVRSGGGQTWQDSSLLEWDPAHFRLFVGNLAGEVTDDSLLKAFAKYPSVQKARVIRDKRSMKSKGYGFVSFSDGDEYFQAARDMQGKYIGSHPVLLRKSTTEIKATVPRDKKKLGKGGKQGEMGGGDRTGAGIQKKQNKTKGGLKIIG